MIGSAAYLYTISPKTEIFVIVISIRLSIFIVYGIVVVVVVVVVVVSCYEVSGQGIESRWGRDFPHPCRLALRPTQTSLQLVPGLFRGYSGRGVALTTHPHQAQG